MSLEKIIKELRAARDILESENRRKMSIDADSPEGVSSSLGELVGVIYRKGRQNFIHEFAKTSRPTLAVSEDSKQLHIVGGRYEITERGIEDL